MSSQPAPAVHSVHFYDEQEALIRRLKGVVASGLEIGNSVIIVATEEHRTELKKTLEKSGIDIRAYERRGQLVLYDARETLDGFMMKGMPNRGRFLSTVGSMLAEAKKSARTSGQGLTVFGEMVAVLWEEGNKLGAIQLEEFWNDLLNDRAFHLHCAYPRKNFTDGDADGLAAICSAHSHVIGETRAVKPALVQ